MPALQPHEDGPALSVPKQPVRVPQQYEDAEIVLPPIELLGEVRQLV